MNQQQDYPLILTAEDIANILMINKNKAYELMKQKGFPTITMGRLKRVNRDSFFKWIEEQQN